MNRLPENPRAILSSQSPVEKPKTKPVTKTKQANESFLVWYGKNKEKLRNEFPELDEKQITIIAVERYKEMEKAAATAVESSPKEETPRENKKRKLADLENDKKQNSEGSTTSKLASFAFAD